MIDYDGIGHLHMKIVLSLISGKPFKLTKARVNDGGINECHLNFLELITKITNGSIIEIDPSNTELIFTPGSLDGVNNGLTHICHHSKPISWYLYPLVILAPLMREGLMDLVLKGATHDGRSMVEGLRSEGNFDEILPEEVSASEVLSIEYMRLVLFPMLAKLDPALGDSGIEVKSRGFTGTAASVKVRIPPVATVKSIELLEMGRVKRIRAQVVSIDVNASFVAAMKPIVAKTLDFCPDAYTYEIKASSARATKNDDDTVERKPKGFGVTVIASTMKGLTRGAECYVEESVCGKNGTFTNLVSETMSFIEGMDDLGQCEDAQQWTEPEWVSFIACTRLMSELHAGGAVDSVLQGIFLIYMALGEETKISKIRLSELTPHTEMWLRHINDFLAVRFDVTNSNAGKEIVFEEKSEEEEEVESEESIIDTEKAVTEELAVPSSVILRCVGVGYTNISKRIV